MKYHLENYTTMKLEEKCYTGLDIISLSELSVHYLMMCHLYLYLLLSWDFCYCAVPQGSILGPVLFFKNANDFPNVANNLFLVYYAENNNVFASGKDIDNLVSQLNKTLLLVWLVKSQQINSQCEKDLYRKISNIRLKIPNLIGAVPTDDAPTTSEWSTILLPTRVFLILEVLRYMI